MRQDSSNTPTSLPGGSFAQPSTARPTSGRGSGSAHPPKLQSFTLEELTDFCAFVILRLFNTPSSSATASPPRSAAVSGNSSPPRTVPLRQFIRYALYRTRLPQYICVHAVYLLHRLKSRFPSARGTESSPHRIFLAALMLSSKILMDDSFSNRSWTVVGQNMFTLKEVNCMERELFAYLDFELTADDAKLSGFVELWRNRWQHQKMQPSNSVRSMSRQTFPLRQPQKRNFGEWADQNEVARDRNKVASIAAHSMLDNLPRAQQRRSPVPQRSKSQVIFTPPSQLSSPELQYSTSASSSSSSELCTPSTRHTSPTSITCGALEDWRRRSYTPPRVIKPTSLENNVIQAMYESRCRSASR